MCICVCVCVDVSVVLCVFVCASVVKSCNYTPDVLKHIYTSRSITHEISTSIYIANGFQPRDELITTQFKLRIQTVLMESPIEYSL